MSSERPLHIIMGRAFVFDEGVMPVAIGIGSSVLRGERNPGFKTRIIGKFQ
jgi:hypothetical protein